MKKLGGLFFLAGLCAFVCANAQPPALINYQGRLLNGTNLVSGTVGLQLSLYDSSSGGSLLYTDSNSVGVVDGLYSTLIGDNTTFGNLQTALGGTQVWLQVMANGTSLSPRERLVSVPYALGAAASGISGTLADAQLSTNVARLYVPNTAQQATAVPQVVNGFVVGATVTFGGSGYLSAPLVTVNGTGVNASVTATITNGSVVGLTVENPGSSYPTNTTLTIAPPPSNAFQIFSGVNYFNGVNTMTNINNIFAGDGAGLTNLTAWRLVGNSGVGTNNFIGTVDANFFQIRVENNPVFTVVNDFGLLGYQPKIIQGHHNNQIGMNSGGSVIAGGGSANFPNRISDNSDVAFIGAGQTNHILSGSGGSFIGAGWDNRISSNVYDGVIAGGSGNKIGFDSDQSVISGGYQNQVLNNSRYASIAGGVWNITSNYYSHVAGGYYNRAYGMHSFAAGYAAVADDDGAMVFATPGEGLFFNSITNNEIAFCARGGMRITGPSIGDAVVTIEADASNSAETNNPSIVLKQDGGLVKGFVALEGLSNGTASNTLSNAMLIGSMDPDPSIQFITDGEARMTIGTDGKTAINTTNNAYTYELGSTNQLSLRVTDKSAAGTWVSIKNDSVSPERNWGLIVAGSANAEGPGTFFIRDQTLGFTRMVILTNGFVGIGTTSPTNRLHVVGSVQATAYITSSDRNMKENIQPVSPEEVLAKVQALPISTWTFKEEANGTHIGPMAQDFHAAFGFGNTDTGIATVDADGVALAAIQALAREKDALKLENQALREEIEAIKRRLDP